MAGFESDRQTLDALGVAVFAASVDPEDKAREVADGVSFPVAYGVTRDDGDRIGAWWEERRGIVQPSEFLIEAGGAIVSSTYSSGPIGRVDPADVARMVTSREARKG